MRVASLVTTAMAACVLGMSASAQTTWQVSAGTAAARTSTYDASASPLRYSGWAAPLHLEATRHEPRSTTAAFASGASTVTGNARPLSNRADREVVSRDEFEAGVSHLRVVSAGEDVRHEVGARLGLAGATRTYDFQDGVSWDLVASLDGVYAVERSFPHQRRLRVEGAVTLIGWVHRPPYFLASDDLFAALYDGEGSFLGLGRVRVPDALQKGTLALSYEHPLTARLSVLGTAGLRALRLTEPETTVTLTRSASVRLAVRL
ncbi:MAG: hypothetical protein AAF791_04585 [Bacteroidota bacterium]